MTCPHADILSRFAEATLSDHQAADVVAHLTVCETCSRKVDELEHFPKQPISLALRDLRNTPYTVDVGDPPLPTRIGQYEILQKIGQGGMGVVYRAVHPHLKREVALKVVRDSRLADPAARERFIREMQSLGKLTHPNIVHATDAGIDDDTPFIVMELLDGQDLGSYIEEHGKMPVKQAVECLRQAATGLAFAHKAGYVHRDIKPSNLFLTRDGVVKILDLGIARPLADNAGEGQTMTGHVVGSPEFMAPEQFRGGTADARSDIYSLGQTFAHLLTGNGELIPVPLKTVLTRMTAGLPDQRYQTINEVLADLDAAPPVRHRTMAIGFVSTIVAVVVLIAVAVAWSRWTPTAPPIPIEVNEEGFQPSAPNVIRAYGTVSPEEYWLTAKEIAQHLSISEDTLYRWIDQKGLPAYKAGRAWRFKKSEVDAWMLRQGKNK